MSQSWITIQTVGDDDNTAATNYNFFMRPEPRENLGPIRLEYDEVFGRKVKVRSLKIGMTRNAKEENRKVVKAYLEPYPHTRIEKAKPLQGWYKGLHEPKGTRPRPCFTEAILTEPYGGWCMVGCAFSLPKGGMVDTPSGPKPIDQFQVGDWVYGRTIEDRRAVRVLGTSSHWKPEGLVVITLSDGRELQMTGDHPVYSRSRGWVSAESLQYGEELEDASMSRLPKHNPSESASVRLLLAESTVCERQIMSGKIFSSQRQTQIGGDAGQDECSRPSPSRQYVSAGQGSEIAGFSIGKSRSCPQRDIGVSTIQASSFHRPQGPNISHEVNLGSIDSPILRESWVRLGLRALGYFVAEWFGLLTRFQTTTPRGLRRSQGVFFRSRPRENSTGQEFRLSNNRIRSKDPRKIRYPYVEKITRVQGKVRVYDIETETGNFYHQGILVHNCYVNSGFRGYRGTGLITVPMNYGEQVRGMLATVQRGAAVYFSSFTDPFLPLEEIYHNSQSAAEACVEVGLPIFFLSRLKYPAWAIDLLKKNPHSYAQKSINTPSQEDWQKLSPGAMDLEGHFADIRRLKKHGIYVSIQVNPVVAGVTSNEQIIELFRRLRKAGADHVIVKFVEAGYSWAPAMVERMIKRFGDRGLAFASLFQENIGGQRTIVEEYRLQAHDLYAAEAKRLGLTYSVCYEYRYERNEAGEIIDKTGVSIGREVTTSAQCHGHAVPVYIRSGKRFRPLSSCPPSGCLYCASENGGQPRCGDTLAGEARALTMADFRKEMFRGI